MRVNFDGSFRDIQRLIAAPEKASTGKADFGDLLSSISPDKQQLADKAVDIGAVKAALDGLDGGAKGRFNFAAPDLIAEQPSAISGPSLPVQDTESAVSEAGASVKTPTIISARRIHEGDPFEGMSKSERVGAVRKLAEAAGLKHGVDPALSLAVVENESSFNAKAISSDGFNSKGLMQLLDSTGRDQLERSGKEAAYKPFDPTLNVDLGVGHLRYLHDIFSQGKELPNKLNAIPAANSSSLEKLAVAAYNAGEGRVASAQQRAGKDGKNPAIYEDVESYLPESTKEYVKRVVADKESYEEGSVG